MLWKIYLLEVFTTVKSQLDNVRIMIEGGLQQWKPRTQYLNTTTKTFITFGLFFSEQGSKRSFKTAVCQGVLHQVKSTSTRLSKHCKQFFIGFTVAFKIQ